MLTALTYTDSRPSGFQSWPVLIVADLLLWSCPVLSCSSTVLASTGNCSQASLGWLRSGLSSLLAAQSWPAWFQFCAILAGCSPNWLHIYTMQCCFYFWGAGGWEELVWLHVHKGKYVGRDFGLCFLVNRHHMDPGILLQFTLQFVSHCRDMQKWARISGIWHTTGPAMKMSLNISDVCQDWCFTSSLGDHDTAVQYIKTSAVS